MMFLCNLRNKVKNRTVLIAVCLSFILLIIGFIGYCHRQPAVDTAEETKRMLQKAIPIGTKSEIVEGFLTAKKIEHGFVEEENTFYAIIRNTKESNWLISSNVTIMIKFNDDRRVKEIDVKRVLTGP